VTLSQEMLPEL